MPASLMRLALLLVALLPAPAAADIFLQGRYTLEAGEHGDGYAFTAEVPETVGAPAEVTWPEGCTQSAQSRATMGGRVRYGFEIECGRAFQPGDVIVTPWKVDGGNFRTSVLGTQVNRDLQPSAGGLDIPVGETAAAPRSVGELATEFTRQGVLHIWLGWDHLAFVFLMCLLARGRHLMWMVTAFTLGHSVSLAAAFLDFIHIPIPPVEAVIALSIAFMAREALLAKGPVEDRQAQRRQLVIVSAFGLLHGLGFASALGELGVLHEERVPALFFFNVGVEIGQLLFVGAMSALMLAMRGASFRPALRTVAAWSMGLIGGYWMVERVAGFALV